MAAIRDTSSAATTSTEASINAAPQRRLPQEEHADLGLIEDDNTEEMRKPPAATRGSQIEHSPTITKEKF